jgi:phosphatidylserine decarboxylase
MDSVDPRLLPHDVDFRMKALLRRLGAHEDLNFLLTNRIPRRLATRFVGWLSRIEQPWVRDVSLAVWRWFSDLDLSDAAETEFRSLHACFTRALKPGSRPVDPDPTILASPCDAIVGACGAIAGLEVLQAKGFPYRLTDLLADAETIESLRDGCYATLRLTAAMYHRFHAPHDCSVAEITYYSGDTWNVNPVALARVERLFCRNERACIPLVLEHGGQRIVLVPVAAILVASIRLNWLDVPREVRTRGTHRLRGAARFAKGDELGWFEHGSTILVFAPRGFALCPGIETGVRILAGRALMRLPPDRRDEGDDAR